MSRAKLRKSSAAPTSSTIDSAISATSSALRTQRPPRAGRRAAALLQHAPRPRRATACHAGARPKRMPVSDRHGQREPRARVPSIVMSVDARDAAGAERLDRRERQIREQHAEHAAGEGEDQAFDEHLR